MVNRKVNPEVLNSQQSLKDYINEIEDRYRGETLHDYLFHQHHYANDDFRPAQKEIEEEFLERKKVLSMAGRLDLALEERYLNIIHVTELGLTRQPSELGDIDGLKHEYHDLLDAMSARGWQFDEKPRSTGSRTMRFEDVGAHPGLTVVRRNRQLLETVQAIELRDEESSLTRVMPIKIDIAKQMIFSVPTGLLLAVRERHQKDGDESTDPQFFDEIDKLIDARQPYISPIRTAYYLATEMQ